MSNPESPVPDLPSRRALLRGGAAVAGGCAASLVASPAAALSQQEAPHDGVFDVRAFGAAGLRSQNATGACQAAIDACAAAGGGLVRVQSPCTSRRARRCS